MRAGACGTLIGMRDLTPSEKGGLAELKIAAAAAELGIRVSRPITEGGRYDLIFDIDGRLVRVQCKHCCRRGAVVVVPTRTNRTTPGGYVRGTYSAADIDAIAGYCPELDEVYLLPIDDVAGQTHVQLRLTPTRNNQAMGVKWAASYRLGAVAQLEERRAGSAKVRGSSPLSSIE